MKNTLSCGRTKPLCQARRRKSERRQNKSFPAKDSPPSLEGNSRTPCPPPPPPLPLKGGTFLISSPSSPSPLSRKRKGEKFKEGSNSQRAERVSGQGGGRGSSQDGDEVDLRLDDSRGLEFPFCILTISQSHMTLTFAGSASSHLPWGSPLLSSASDSFSHWILFLLLG